MYWNHYWFWRQNFQVLILDKLLNLGQREIEYKKRRVQPSIAGFEGAG